MSRLIAFWQEVGTGTHSCNCATVHRVEYAGNRVYEAHDPNLGCGIVTSGGGVVIIVYVHLRAVYGCWQHELLDSIILQREGRSVYFLSKKNAFAA